MTTQNIALIGNPNTGKSSLFNALTGANQRVGNYPGVTVEKKLGIWNLESKHLVQLFDLPGTYSLRAQSPDERIAVDVLTGHVEGICVAAPCAWILHRFCLRGQSKPPYFMELPAYKPPNLRHILVRVFASGRDFMVRAGTVIFAMTIIIWALLYFPRPPELAQQLEQDLLATIEDCGGHSS